MRGWQNRCSWTLLMLMFAAAPATHAEVVEIQWSGDGRFAHSGAVAAGKFLELCGKLPAGLKVSWEFEASAPMDFNVHYHVDKDVIFPAKLSAVAMARDMLTTQIPQDYCWMWTNPSAAAARLSVKLQR